jgi:hypothetical protein
MALNVIPVDRNLLVHIPSILKELPEPLQIIRTPRQPTRHSYHSDLGVDSARRRDKAIVQDPLAKIFYADSAFGVTCVHCR